MLACPWGEQGTATIPCLLREFICWDTVPLLGHCSLARTLFPCQVSTDLRLVPMLRDNGMCRNTPAAPCWSTAAPRAAKSPLAGDEG